MSGASGLEYLKPFLPGLEPVLADPDVSEIMINGPNNVWIERAGRLQPHPAPALDERALARAAIHIARPLGLDPAQKPIVDARLEDGSRVAICVPPASPQGGHHRAALRQAEFFARRSGAARFPAPGGSRGGPRKALLGQHNILVSGGTGSGKTTLLNALIELLPDDDRIVSIEDTLELRIDHSNCVRFEARGIDSGAVTIRDLVQTLLAAPARSYRGR